MSEAGGALFLQDADAAPSLADGMLPGMAEELDAALDAEVRDPDEARSTLGEYSGARFFSKNPRLYLIVVRLLAEGLPVRAIERAVGVSAHLVEAVRAREASSMETKSYSRMMAGKVRGVMMQAADELRARLEDDEKREEMSTRDLIAAMDRLSSIERDMAGEPQSIQRVIQPVGVDPRIAALLGACEAEVVEVSEGVSENGLGGEKRAGAAQGARAEEGQVERSSAIRTGDGAEVAAEEVAEGACAPSV